MKIKIIHSEARVKGIIQLVIGDVIDIPLPVAEGLIRLGHAESVDVPLPAPPPPPVVETREPEVEVRDPVIEPPKSKRGRPKKNEL